MDELKLNMDTLEESLSELYKYKIELTNKLNMINREISILEEEKIKKCKHNFVSYREEGMYGEILWKCSICGIYRGF